MRTGPLAPQVSRALPRSLPDPRGEASYDDDVRHPALAGHRVTASERLLFRTAKRADPVSGT